VSRLPGGLLAAAHSLPSRLHHTIHLGKHLGNTVPPSTPHTLAIVQVYIICLVNQSFS
jgi:hypothetical protein